MQSLHAKQWEAALAAEFAQLQISGTFEWVERVPEGRKAIGSKAVYREKCDGEGKTVKYKVRIVMKGYSQIPGQDFDLMFSLVVKFMMLRVLLSLSTHENWELHQVDVMGVYLQGDLNE